MQCLVLAFYSSEREPHGGSQELFRCSLVGFGSPVPWEEDWGGEAWALNCGNPRFYPWS